MVFLAFFGEYVFSGKIVLLNHNENFDNYYSIIFPFTIVIITEIYIGHKIILMEIYLVSSKEMCNLV